MCDAIFLSAGVPDPKRGAIYAATANTVAITSAVSALIHVTIGRRPLIWGGHPAITPMIMTMAQAIGVNYGSWVQLYQSRYFEDQFPEDNAQFRNVFYIDAIENDREKSLFSMRERMFSEHEFGAAVFIGGMEGIIDEFELFKTLQPTAKIMPITSTGGAALEVAKRNQISNDDFLNDLDYVSLFHRYLEISTREERYISREDQPSIVEQRFWQPPN